VEEKREKGKKKVKGVEGGLSSGPPTILRASSISQGQENITPEGGRHGKAQYFEKLLLRTKREKGSVDG